MLKRIKIEKRIRTVALILLPFLLMGCFGETNELPNRQYRIVWEDNFNGATGELPDTVNNWTFEIGRGVNGWGNNELQYYTARTENAVLNGTGQLIITALQEDYQGAGYTSARMITKGKREFQYGRFEARIKTPFSQGLWPAFWMLGSDIDDNPWPAAGEIDIMELRGQEPSTIAGSIHGPGYSGGNAVTSDYTLLDGRFDTEFHVFAVEWGPNFIDFYVDDFLYQQLTPADLPEDSDWVFDKDFFLLLNLAVGGNYVGNPNQNSRFPQTLTVDYVRVYEQVQ